MKRILSCTVFLGGYNEESLNPRGNLIVEKSLKNSIISANM